MTETEIEQEAKQEFTKSMEELAKDSIREANTLRQNPATEKDNLDIIKHLIKRLAIHQVILEKRANETNRWLLFLTLVTTIAALPTIINMVANFLSLVNNLKLNLFP